MNDNVKLALYRFRYAIILLAVVLGLTLATPKFFSSNNFLNILWAVSIVGIISMGATFVILVWDRPRRCPASRPRSGSTGEPQSLRL